MKTPEAVRLLTTMALAALLAALAVACSEGTLTGSAPCVDESDCREGLSCHQGVCSRPDDAGGDLHGLDATTPPDADRDADPDADRDADTAVDAPASCDDGRPRCGADCCAADAVCREGACTPDCGAQVFCGGACCDPDHVCEGGTCMTPCSGTRCGEALELCCDSGDVCFGGACIEPGGACERTEECGIEEICEPALGLCLPRDQVAVCEFIPPAGVFNPVVGCEWHADGLPVRPDRGDVVATPLVANLTDDNGDGLTDTDDVPNIVFLSFNRASQGCCNVDSTIRIVHGECDKVGLLTTVASIHRPQTADGQVLRLNNDTGMAIGDLTGDGVPEIVAVTMEHHAGGDTYRPQGTVALQRVADDGSAWEVLWHNATYPTWNVHTRGGATIGIADLDGDGDPEVIIGNVALNGQTGELLWDGVVTGGGSGGIGNNAFLGPASVVADVTLDERQEVMAGNTLYDYQGNVLWTFDYPEANSSCHGTNASVLPCDGYAGVARFDDVDAHPHIVLVRLGQLYILDHLGEEVWRVDIPHIDCMRNGLPANEGGPPTIADFNGDGHREIGTASADYYVVAKRECDVPEWESLGCAARGILWVAENDDCSSRVTASSLFDFLGDGRTEMVYADENTFWIFDGSTGAVLFADERHQSNTRIEMPAIADVDNDGSANVVIASAYGNRAPLAPGIRVYRDRTNNWVRTRRIWNQHAYAVTNVEEDGTIPAVPERNWLDPRLNNFRQNVQPTGLFDAPDLVISALEVNDRSCGSIGRLDLTIRVANEGALSVPPGVLVELTVGWADEAVVLGLLETTTRLFPGQFEIFELSWELPTEVLGVPLTVEAVADPENDFNECDEENNAAALEVLCEASG